MDPAIFDPKVMLEFHYNVFKDFKLKAAFEIKCYYVKYRQGERVLEDACGANNGGCSHLCLRSNHGFSCACPTGILFQNKTELNPKTCKQHPDNFLVFATRGSVAVISLDTPEQWDVTLPVKNVQNSIAVDFHWERKLIFFTDVNNDVIR